MAGYAGMVAQYIRSSACGVLYKLLQKMVANGKRFDGQFVALLTRLWALQFLCGDLGVRPGLRVYVAVLRVVLQRP